METLGDFLKHGREEAGISLEDLAARTRIRIENLRSLEGEDLDSLPTDPYVRGFVKLVCRELGLQPEDGLVRYETLRRRSGPLDEITWEEEKTEARPGVLERALGDPGRIVRIGTTGARWLGIAAAAVAVTVLLVVVIRWVDPLAPRTTEPVAFLPAEEPPVPEPDLASPPPALPQPLPETETVPPTGSGVPTEAPAESESGPGTGAQLAAAEVPRPTPPEPIAPRRNEITGSRPAGPSLVLRVEAVRPVEITVLLDGAGHPRRRSLVAGDSKSWKADRLFVLSASDGGAIRLYLQEEDLGPAGPPGEPVEGLRIRPR